MDALQDELGRRGSELTSTLAKLQQQQQTLTIQVQKAEAERVKEARRAKEAAKAAPLERPAVAPAATPLQQQQEREREQKAAEAQAGEAAIVKQLQEENAELKGRVAALEKVLEKDGLQGLIQEALAAAGKTAAGDPTTHSPDPHATLDNQPARRARRVCRVCRSFGRIVRGFCTAGQRRFQPLGPRPGRRFHPVC